MITTSEEITLFYESVVSKTLDCERFLKITFTVYYKKAGDEYAKMILNTSKSQTSKSLNQSDNKRLNILKRALVKVVNKKIVNDSDREKFLDRIENSDFIGITETIGEILGYLHL